MTAYRTCIGCIHQGAPCEARDRVRATLKGFGVTSIKWRCPDRQPRYRVGDPVWALTVAQINGGEYDERGNPIRDYFPAVVVDPGKKPTKALVSIDPGAAGRGDFGDGIIFDVNSSGFCNIPLSRLQPRDGEREEICKYCCNPVRRGHTQGFNCNPV